MEYRLEELFDLQMGKTPSRNNLEYWATNNNKWISIADLSRCGKYISETKEFLSDNAIAESGINQIPKDTVVMSFKLSIGKTAITAEPMYSNEAVMSFLDKHVAKLLPEYVYYLLLAHDWNEGTNKAVMGKTLNKATLSKVKVAVHPYKEQAKIVEILNKASELLTARQQQLQKLDELVKARFVEMFGDPVQNPLKWVTKSLLEMGYCKNGVNFHSGDSGIEIHCLGVGDFKDYSVVDGTDYLPTISLSEEPPEESMLQDGDIVFVRSNGNKALVGRCLVVYPHNTPTTYSGFCIRYRLTSDEVNTSYLLRVLKADSMRKKMIGHGANIQNLNQKTLATLNIPIPPMELQEQFAEFVNQTDKSKLLYGIYDIFCQIIADGYFA